MTEQIRDRSIARLIQEIGRVETCDPEKPDADARSVDRPLRFVGSADVDEDGRTAPLFWLNAGRKAGYKLYHDNFSPVAQHLWSSPSWFSRSAFQSGRADFQVEAPMSG